MRNVEAFYANRSVILFVHDQGDYISDSIFEEKSFFEAGILDLLYKNRALLKPVQSCVVDVGANIGNHASFFENYLNFKEVYAIEPVAKNFELLLKNTSRSHCIKAACSSDYRQVTIVGEVHNMGNSRIVSTEESVGNNIRGTSNYTEVVSTIKLDDLRLSDVSLIKVDVEGHEQYCLEGAMETIQRCKPMLWIESHTKEFIERFSNKSEYKVLCSDNYINYILCPKTSQSQKVIYL